MEHFLLRHFVLEYYYLVQLDCKMKIERLNLLGIFTLYILSVPARRQAGTRQGGRYLEK